MLITIELNQTDICQLIADKYHGVNANDVSLYVTKELRGYPPMEHEVDVISAKITFKSEEEASASFS